MVNRLRLAYVFISFVAGVLGSPLEPDCPRHRGLPDGLSRAENKVKGRDRALYRLDLRDALKGYIPNNEYTLRVHTTARKVHFNDATVVIDAVDSSCGAGSWVIDSEELYSPKGCPSVVTTQQKEPMGRAHFVWRAPSCGCVHFRARIHVNSTYFLDDESVHIGPLAKIICPQDGYTKEPVTEQTNTVEQSPAKLLSRGDLHELLCEVVEAHDPEDVLNNDEFILKRTMSKLNSFERDRLHIAVEQRHEDLKQCCDIDNIGERRECIGDVRRVRIDRFCGSGEPDIPLTKTRYDWVKRKQPECCPQIGEARYICFNYTLSGDAMLGDEGERQAVMDMDDFDPVHYVEDYPQASAIKEKFSTRHQGKDRHSLKEENNKMSDAQYDNAAASKDAVTQKSMKESHAVGSNSKQVEHKEDSTEEAPKTANNARKSKVRHSDADDSGEVNHDDKDDSEQVVENKEADRYLSLEECCMNGIDAGTRVSHQGFEGCFQMADKFHTFFSQWNRKCDRHFVICCMRVIDGDIVSIEHLKQIDVQKLYKQHKHVFRTACKSFSSNIHFGKELSESEEQTKRRNLLTKLSKFKSPNETTKLSNVTRKHDTIDLKSNQTNVNLNKRVFRLTFKEMKLKNLFEAKHRKHMEKLSRLKSENMVHKSSQDDIGYTTYSNG